MGMFDYVRYSAKCPICEGLITEWQSKSGPCRMDTLEPWQVDSFHAPCSRCHAWVDATVEAEVEHVVKRLDVSLRAQG
jgi:hypothetical protein